VKWAVIGHKVFEKRYQALSEFLRSLGTENTVAVIDCQPENFPETLETAMAEYDQLRIDSPLRGAVVRKFKLQSKVISDLGAADCLIKRGGKWWPDCGLYYAFTQLFSRHGSRLDLSADMLVVGAGAAGRLAIAAGLRAGYSHINLTSKFDDEGIYLLGELKKSYFGVTFEFVPQDRLVLLPGSNSLLINTTPLDPSNDLLEELYYLNFLKPDGMIWDLVIEPETTALIREGEQINIGCVRGVEIAALTDAQWIEWVTGRKVGDGQVLTFYKSRT
jgi:shikimate 5-dehydrogenase